MPAAAVIPDLGPYVAAGSVEAFGCLPVLPCLGNISSLRWGLARRRHTTALHCARCGGKDFQHKMNVSSLPVSNGYMIGPLSLEARFVKMLL